MINGSDDNIKLHTGNGALSELELENLLLDLLDLVLGQRVLVLVHGVADVDAELLDEPEVSVIFFKACQPCAPSVRTEQP